MDRRVRRGREASGRASRLDPFGLHLPGERPRSPTVAVEAGEPRERLLERGGLQRVEHRAVALAAVMGPSGKSPGGREGDEARGPSNPRAALHRLDQAPEPRGPVAAASVEPLDDGAVLDVDGVDRDRVEMRCRDADGPDDVLDGLAFRQVWGLEQQVGLGLASPRARTRSPAARYSDGRRALVDELAGGSPGSVDSRPSATSISPGNAARSGRASPVGELGKRLEEEPSGPAGERAEERLARRGVDLPVVEEAPRGVELHVRLVPVGPERRSSSCDRAPRAWPSGPGYPSRTRTSSSPSRRPSSIPGSAGSATNAGPAPSPSASARPTGSRTRRAPSPAPAPAGGRVPRLRGRPIRPCS